MDIRLVLINTNETRFTDPDIVNVIDNIKNDLPETYKIKIVPPQPQIGFTTAWWDTINVLLENIPEELVDFVIRQLIDAGYKLAKGLFKEDDNTINQGTIIISNSEENVKSPEVNSTQSKQPSKKNKGRRKKRKNKKD